MVAFSAGCICFLICAGLLAMAYASHNPFRESDALPFLRSVSMNGIETRIEFTASTNENYALHLNINLPADAKEKWVEYSCLMGSTPTYYSCKKMGRLNFTWTIRDVTDGNWHNWEAASKPRFEAIDGVGTGEIGWFTPVIHHGYVVTFKADPDTSVLHQSPANLHAYFADYRTQSIVAWGDFFSLMWEALAGLFLIVGLPLVLIFFPRQKRAQV